MFFSNPITDLIHSKRTIAGSLSDCGRIGAAYGSVVGCIYGSVLLFFFGTVVGLICGALGGFVSGVIGGTFNKRLGWIVAGMVGGLFCWLFPVQIFRVRGSFLDSTTFDLESILLYAAPSLIGGLLGFIISLGLKHQDASLPLINELRRIVEASPLNEWTLSKRYMLGALEIFILFLVVGVLEYVKR